jgi:hypothetical protein
MPKVASALLGKDVISCRPGDAEGSGRLARVVPTGGELLQRRAARRLRVDTAQGLVLNKGARLHPASMGVVVTEAQEGDYLVHVGSIAGMD